MTIRPEAFLMPPTPYVLLCQHKIEVIGHVKIKVAIVIIIGKGTARSPPVIPHPRPLRYIGKRPIAIVAIKDVGTKVGDVDVPVPIVVVVSHAHSHAIVPIPPDPRSIRHIGKRPIAVVTIKNIARAGPLVREVGAVHHINIHIAIVVVIKKGGPGTHGLN